MKIAETLLQCSACAHQFGAPFTFGEVSHFETATISGVGTECPKCHQNIPVEKARMAYRLPDGMVGGAGPHFTLTKDASM